MVLLVFKKVKTFNLKDNVPKQWLNLEHGKYVTCFKYHYPNMKEILEKQYSLKPEDRIIIQWTKEIDLPHFRRYRMKFKTVWRGKIKNLGAS